MTTFAFLPSIGIPELLVILLIVLVIFGAGKLPGIGKAVGQSIKEFKSSVNENKEQPVNAAVEKE